MYYLDSLMSFNCVQYEFEVKHIFIQAQKHAQIYIIYVYIYNIGIYII